MPTCAKVLAIFDDDAAQMRPHGMSGIADLLFWGSGSSILSCTETRTQPECSCALQNGKSHRASKHYRTYRTVN